MAQIQLKGLSKGKGKISYLHLYAKGIKNVRFVISTKIEYNKNYSKADGFFKSNKSDYLELNARLRYLKNRADEYLTYCDKNKHAVDLNEAKEYIFNDKNLNIYQAVKKVQPQQEQEPVRLFAMEYYSDFYEFKKQEVSSIYSLKDYKSLWNALLDFEYDNKRFSVVDMNSLKWVYDFRDYLRKPRPSKGGLQPNQREYLSKGMLQDSTINKRLQSLKNWFNWIEKKGLCNYSKDVMNYNVAKGVQEINSLSVEEIKQIYSCDKYTDEERYIVDIFVMNCYMGLRYSDLKDFDKKNFQKLSDGMYYVIFNSKTNKRIEVPLLPTAREILEKYNYELKISSDQVLNRRIKEILAKYELLEVDVYVNSTVNEKTQQKRVKLREIVSTHICRKTFVTLALDAGVPHNTIMNSTGHTQLSTLQKYAKRKRNFAAFKSMGV
jgi:integrase